MPDDSVNLKSQDVYVEKPLKRFQEYLIASKTSIVLIRELLVELKELIVILALIAFFIWGVIELFYKLQGS